MSFQTNFEHLRKTTVEKKSLKQPKWLTKARAEMGTKGTGRGQGEQRRG